jgi:hypothetical protein
MRVSSAAQVITIAMTERGDRVETNRVGLTGANDEALPSDMLSNVFSPHG